MKENKQKRDKDDRIPEKKLEAKVLAFSLKIVQWNILPKEIPSSGSSRFYDIFFFQHF